MFFGNTSQLRSDSRPLFTLLKLFIHIKNVHKRLRSHIFIAHHHVVCGIIEYISYIHSYWIIFNQFTLFVQSPNYLLGMIISLTSFLRWWPLKFHSMFYPYWLPRTKMFEIFCPVVSCCMWKSAMPLRELINKVRSLLWAVWLEVGVS